MSAFPCGKLFDNRLLKHIHGQVKFYLLSDKSLNFYFVFQKYKKLAESDKLDEFLLLTNNFSVPLILKGGICYFPSAFVQS